MRKLAERGSEGPRRVIDSKPGLYTHLIPYYEAFETLNSCRYPGPVGVSKIPWTAINEYGYRYEFEGDDFRKLAYFVEVLDRVFLASLDKSGKKGANR